MNRHLVFDGKDLTDFECYAGGDGTFPIAERDIEKVKIAGRNGELHIDQGKYNNVDMPYDCYILKDFAKNFDSLKSFLLSKISYKRLEDDFHPEYFRMARIKPDFKPKISGLAEMGTFTLTFDCKPQKFLKSGEKKITLTSSSTIKNPTYYDANPILTIYGVGTLLINDQQIKIDKNDTSITIDTDIMEAYSGSTNMNAYVELPDDKVVLPSGNDSIGLTGITKLVIIPRWWTL